MLSLRTRSCLVALALLGLGSCDLNPQPDLPVASRAHDPATPPNLEGVGGTSAPTDGGGLNTGGTSADVGSSAGAAQAPGGMQPDGGEGGDSNQPPTDGGASSGGAASGEGGVASGEGGAAP